MATNAQTQQEPTWQTRVATKRARRDAAIPDAWRLHHVEQSTKPISDAVFQYSGAILSQDDIDITSNYTAHQLLQKLAASELTAVAVTQAFSKRATIAHQLTNCQTETFFDLAIERAKFLDSYLQKEGKPFGPLHGLPISIKDTFQVQNVDTTIGYVSFIDNPPATVNSAMVQILLDLGAILYVKTNIPQTLMTADSDNNVFGRVLNPYNTNLTADGSSGGEGALVSLRGSCIGIGRDIAGSIRIPALCCGTYGFKPTTNRIPYGGQVSPAALGMPGIIPCAGPLTNSMADVKLLMESVLGGKPWNYDSTAHAVPCAPKSYPPICQPAP
jgi:amidase